MAILKADAKTIPLSQKKMLYGWNDDFMEELIIRVIESFGYFGAFSLPKVR